MARSRALLRWFNLAIIGTLFSSRVASSPPDVLPDDSRIFYEGRVLHGSGKVSMDWPCTTIHVQVTVSDAGYVVALMDGGGSNFLISMSSLDGKNTKEETLNTTSGMKNYTIADFPEKTKGQYTIDIRKLSEAAFEKAVTTFAGLYFSSSALTLAPAAPARPQRRIEFLGDSDTAGFGIHGKPGTLGALECLAQPARAEDCNADYSALLARSLGAEMHNQAWSGKGVARNAAHIIPFALGKETMPEYWTQTLATDKTKETEWNFNQWVPDLVIVYLGSNDCNNLVAPDQSKFTSAYEKMLTSIFASYVNASKAPILANVCGGGKTAEDSNMHACDLVKNASLAYSQSHPVEAKSMHFIEIPLGVLKSGDWGCIGHRNAAGQLKIASFLEPHLRTIMNWESALVI